MKYLGIDFGTKRVGVSMSDDGGRIAFAKEIISNDKDLFNKIGEILKKEKVEGVIVGESVDQTGLPNPVASLIEDFILELKNRFGVSVYKEKEFFTSIEARRYSDGKKRVDAAAAALILQRFLDRNNKNGNN